MRRIAFAAVTAAATVSAGTAVAQAPARVDSFPTTRPTLGPPKVLHLPPATERRLANGLRLVVVQKHELPLADFALVVGTGTEADPAGHEGLATMTAAMLDEGTTTRSSLQIADQAAFLGVSLSTGAGWDGLREHCLGVAQAVSAIARPSAGIDRDVAVTGALLHDIGKLEAYTDDPDKHRPDRRRSAAGRDRARLLRDTAPDRGHRRLPGRAGAGGGHIILSHHGTLEHGSPVVPCTREATLVHMIDNLGGRLGSFDRLEKELGAGRRWSRIRPGDRLGRVLPGRARRGRPSRSRSARARDREAA